MVWVKLSTSLSLDDPRCHDYNNTHAVEVVDPSGIKEDREDECLSMSKSCVLSTHPSDPNFLLMRALSLYTLHRLTFSFAPNDNYYRR